MSNSNDVELILRTIDDAIRDWQEKYKTTTNELIDDIRKLFYASTQILIQLSIATDDHYEQMKDDQMNAERIVTKLKELQHSMNHTWPANMESFGRDVFEVDSYHVEAAEFFYPTRFYPNDDLIMKLYRWSVYDTNGTVIYRYYLERSEIMPGQPYYVLGKTYPNGHSQIQPYGAHAPDYIQMKIHVVQDLKGQGPPPVISLTLPAATSS